MSLTNDLETLLFDASVTTGQKNGLKDRIKNELEFDDLNLEYFLTLYRKFKNPGNTKKQVVIHEAQLPEATPDIELAWPTAIAPVELMNELPLRQYTEILKDIDPKEARHCVVWIKKMQAGTGSSIVRQRYLAEKCQVPLEKVKIGAKGTDLFIEMNGRLVSLAEIQMMQSLYDADEAVYAGVELHDIVSDETADAFDAIWKKPCPYAEGKTYEQLAAATDAISRFNKTFQHQIPTIDEHGEITFRRKAPGGHGLFGVDAIRAAFLEGLRPDTKTKTLVSCIGNGEDLGSSPDPYMVAWMATENIPIAMVTTTKTNIDLKGGQIALLRDDQGNTFLTIIEKAQADQSNQTQLFLSLGLRDHDAEAFFNTNMVLINYSVLSPLIEGLVDEIGENALMEVIAPDLIQNLKEQVDPDGVERKYLQLEGAMGSVILNLDRYYRTRHNQPLVHILNVDVKHRTQFFCPIKTGFDFFMQFASDRFRLDQRTYRLLNQNPGRLPLVELKDAWYKDVFNVLDAFEDVSVRDLERLDVEGLVDFKTLTLAGDVEIRNHCSHRVNLTQLLSEKGVTRLQDVQVIIAEDGNSCELVEPEKR